VAGLRTGGPRDDAGAAVTVLVFRAVLVDHRAGVAHRAGTGRLRRAREERQAQKEHRQADDEAVVALASRLHYGSVLSSPAAVGAAAGDFLKAEHPALLREGE